MAQSSRLDVSADPIRCQSPGRFPESYWSTVYMGILKELVLTLVKEYCRTRADELTRECEGSGQKVKFSSPMFFNTGCQQKAWPSFRLGLPASNNLPKNIPYRSAHLTGF